jgi:hypothetical protein
MKLTKLALHQPLPLTTNFLLATMWIAGTPSDGICNNNHKLRILPEVQHVPFVVTLIALVRNGLLAILPSLAIFP